MFAGETSEGVSSDSTTTEKAFTVMSGVFTVGENHEIPTNGKITVKDINTGEVIGIYNPNPTTGKYLYILEAGKTYDLTYEVEGSVYKSENLIIPVNNSYKRIKRKINLGW